MKSLFKILIFSLFAVNSYAQQATEIDSKSVKLPRYASEGAVTAAIPTPTQGMLIYRTDTKSNWYYNGSDWVNMNEVKAPLSLSFASSIPFSNTFASSATGTNGRAGQFLITNASNTENALYASTAGTGSAIRASSSGFGIAITSSTNSGSAGLFEISSSGNINNALTVSTLGSGSAIVASSAGIGNTIYGTNSGMGKAAFFQGTNALETNGTIKFGGSGVGAIAAGKVLTSDDVGNATWQAIPSVVAPLSLTSSATTLTSTSTGASGNAGHFIITNPASSSSVIEAETSGSGYAGSFIGQNAISADGLIKNKGFTQLGELSDKIKTVTLGAYIGAGSVETITHSLNAGKILSINVYASLEDGLPPHLRIPPSFISLGTEYYYDYYFDDTKIYFIIPGSSTKVKNFFAKVLISYTE